MRLLSHCVVLYSRRDRLYPAESVSTAQHTVHAIGRICESMRPIIYNKGCLSLCISCELPAALSGRCPTLSIPISRMCMLSMSRSTTDTRGLVKGK